MDNSDLFSLNELHSLEDQRAAAEAAAEVAARQSERSARLDAEARAQAAIDAVRRSDEEERRSRAATRERTWREEELRLIQTEARMEETAQRLLEAARAETDARADAEIRAGRPIGTLVAMTVAALLAVAGVGTWLMRGVDAEVAHTRAMVAAEAEADRAALITHQEAARQRFAAELAQTRERLAATTAESGRQAALAKRAAQAQYKWQRAQAMLQKADKAADGEGDSEAGKEVAAVVQPAPILGLETALPTE